ncbi:hypothetical protein [Paenibacillus oryzae]|uniref:hypothetical protein n=1 Tax=Paenibacillus oryzae TaxID=1844972 RepID=UPI0012EAA90F|nr:hypothetical protein [Paenibacillus oryzae]
MDALMRSSCAILRGTWMRHAFKLRYLAGTADARKTAAVAGSRMCHVQAAVLSPADALCQSSCNTSAGLP